MKSLFKRCGSSYPYLDYRDTNLSEHLLPMSIEHTAITAVVAETLDENCTTIFYQTPSQVIHHCEVPDDTPRAAATMLA